MARIENTTVYPTITPSANDLLIGTDVSNDNETVTFLVSSLTGGAGVLQGLQSVLDTGNTAIENINLTGNITVVGSIIPTTITAGGLIGTAGQVLSSTGAGLQWVAASGSNASWNDTLLIGNTATTASVVSSTSMTFTGVGADLRIAASATLTGVGVSTFTGNVNINSTDLIFNSTGQISAGGSTGTAGQWLVSTGTGLEWSSSIPVSSCCPLQSTLNAGNVANNIGITFTGSSTTTFTSGNSINSAGNNLWSGNNRFSANGVTSTTAGIYVEGSFADSTGSTGTTGQVLTSTITGVRWATSASGTNTLQQVLDAGNIATGANALINISGSLTVGTIIDTSLSAGAAGQVLSSTGSGLAWIPTTCCNLNDTLAVGATSNLSMTLTGTATITVPTVIPTNIQASGSTGSNGQFLGIAAGLLTWITPGIGDTTYSYSVPNNTTNLSLLSSAGILNDITLTGGTGVTVTRNSSSQLTLSNDGIVSVTIGSPLISSGSPLTLSTTNGVVTLSQRVYVGGSNLGVVPAGGQNTTFLRGDGTWAIPSGGSGGVTQVLLGSSGISTGQPLTVTTVGTVATVSPKRYAGGSLEGFVPQGGTNTSFLRGDGTWAIPTGSGGGSNNFSTNFKFGIVDTNLYLNFYAYSNITQGSWSPSDGDKLVFIDSVGGDQWTNSQKLGATIYNNANNGATTCPTDTLQSNLCAAQISLTATAGANYLIELYKWDPCNVSAGASKVGATQVNATGTDNIVCSTITMSPNFLVGTEALYFSVKGVNNGVGSMQGRCDLRWTYTAVA
jgi:hypothetical protein|tara:strand:- start:8574 stop:10934 length:2361 start_codon:yes stop_codon:yes gene_type:complete